MRANTGLERAYYPRHFWTVCAFVENLHGCCVWELAAAGFCRTFHVLPITIALHLCLEACGRTQRMPVTSAIPRSPCASRRKPLESTGWKAQMPHLCRCSDLPPPHPHALLVALFIIVVSRVCQLWQT